MAADLAPLPPPGVREGFDMGYYSHYPVLARAVTMTIGPVLELGMGWGSTPLLHALCTAQDRRLWSADSDIDWVKRFEPFASDGQHGMDVLPPGGLPITLRIPWSVVFIDCAPGEIRKDLALKLKDHAEFIILHDAETDGYYGKGGGGNYRYYEIDQLWKYKEVYRLLQPATLILSDTRPFGLSKFEQGLE